MTRVARNTRLRMAYIVFLLVADGCLHGHAIGEMARPSLANPQGFDVRNRSCNFSMVSRPCGLFIVFVSDIAKWGGWFVHSRRVSLDFSTSVVGTVCPQRFTVGSICKQSAAGLYSNRKQEG